MGDADERLESQRGWIAFLVTRALRARGATEIEYDAGQTVLRYKSSDGKPEVAGLIELFDDCLDAGAEERTALIDRFVATHATSDVLASWEKAALLLRPLLRPTRMAKGTDLGGPLLAREFQPLLNEMVVVDRPGLMVYVSERHLPGWDVTAAMVFEQARANLRATAHWPSLPESGPDQPAVVHFADSGSEYWASHLLIDGWLAGMAGSLGERPVAFLPDEKTLQVVADTPELFDQLFAANEQVYLAAKVPLSPQAYTVDDEGRVVPYSVPPGDPLWNEVHRSEVLFASREYSAQEAEFDEYDDMSIGILSSLKVKHLPDRACFSVAAWGEGVFGMLPKADYVAFVNDSGLFMVRWEVVVRETGLVPEPGWSPVRYRYRTWPDPPTMERLRAAATPPPSPSSS